MSKPAKKRGFEETSKPPFEPAAIHELAIALHDALGMVIERLAQVTHSALSKQVRGRARIWRLALYLSFISLAYRFDSQQPTCQLLYYPRELAENYAVFGLCVFLMAGLTNWGKVMLGIVIFVAFVSQGLTHPRIPMNQYRTELRLRELHADLDSSHLPANDPLGALNQYPFDGGQSSWYRFDHSYKRLPDGTVKYSVTASPCYYCLTGQRSYLMDEQGRIYYTLEDRAATVQDPLVDQTPHAHRSPL